MVTIGEDAMFADPTAPPTIYLIVDSQNRLADEPEAAQLPEQLVMAECLAAGGKAGALGRLLQ